MSSKFRVFAVLTAGLMALAAFFLLRLPAQPDSLAQNIEYGVATTPSGAIGAPEFISNQAVGFGESVSVRSLSSAAIATTIKGYKFETVEDKMDALRLERENEVRKAKGMRPLSMENKEKGERGDRKEREGKERYRRTEGKEDDHEKNELNTERVKRGMPGQGNARKGNFFDEMLAPAIPSVMPTPAVSFDGTASADNTAVFGSTFAPPDTVGDVGPNHYVQMVNSLVAIYNKSGTLLVPKFRLSSITGAAGGPCASANDGDPIVLYDPLADRWLLSQFCVTPVPGHQVIAISKTPDPTGAYYVYDFVHPTSDFQDYPHIGVWPSGYFMSTNQFNQAGTAFRGAGAFAYDRVKMVAGDPTASYVYANEFTSVCPSCGGQLPTDIDGTVTPPVDSPNLFMEFRADEFGDPVDGLRIFAFTPNFAAPAASTFTQVGTDLPFAPFDGNSPTGRSIVEQPGTTQGLDAIADRMMHRIGYRNLGSVASPVNSYVVNFTVNVGGAAGTTAATYQAGIRWAELRRDAVGGMSVNQQGTQATNPGNPAGGTNVWMGSVAQDNAGGIFVGYSSSGSTDVSDFPSVKYAGRSASDPAGTLAQGEGVGVLGTGFQSGASGRWGDYSAASVDPSDECSFWYTQEYRTAANNGNPFNWNTRIMGGVKLPGCTAPQRGTISGTVTSCSTGQPIAGASVTSTGGFATGTDAAGNYTFINVPVGITGVSATRSGGFSTASNNGVVVTNAGAATANLCLTSVPVLSAGTPTLVSESCLPANGVIDPGETVTVAFPVSNTGQANTVNDIGALQATGGVTSPGGSQIYGVITGGGAAVTRNYTFTASPLIACGTNITATIAHVDGATNLGSLVYTIPTGVNSAPVTASYTSPAVPIPDNSAAGVDVPLLVSGVPGSVADLNFRIDGTASSADPTSTTVGLNHSFIGDVKFRLTSPQGTTVEIMTAGGGATSCAANNIYQMTLDDQAAAAMTCPGGTSTGPLTGTFTPSSPLSAFNGQSPNGTWKLNVSDNAGVDTGSLLAYSLIVTGKSCCGDLPTPTPSPTPTPTPTPTPGPTPSPTPTPTACAFSNGGLNPQTVAENGAVAPSGFLWSEVQHNTGNLTVANASAGFGAIQDANRLADNFTLTQPCTLNSVAFYGYVTSAAATPSPFTGYTLRIWKGRPGDAGSSVIFGDTATNRLASSVDTKYYRIFNSLVPNTSLPPGTARKIWRNTVTVGTVLPQGTYWLDWAATAAGGANNFHPSKTIPGSRGAAGDNARQLNVLTGIWADVVDSGSPATTPDVPQDFPFDINGAAAVTQTPYEGDINRTVVGLPGFGDGDINVGDQIQYQRFLSGADCPSLAPSEQQRLDAGPRSTLGDGLLGSSDGTAIDAYARHDAATDFDPNTPGWQPTPAGGPTAISNLGCTPIANPDAEIVAAPMTESASDSAARVVRVVPGMGSRDSDVTVEIEMNALGNEAGTQFGLHFDPAVLKISDISGVDLNPDITLAADAPAGTTLNVNAADAALGNIGIVENFNGTAASLSPISAGPRRIARFKFRVLDGASFGTSKITFDDSVINGVTSDVNGLILAAVYDQNGSVAVPAGVGITISGRVTGPDGRGIRNAMVTVVDRSGFARTAVTSSFGYYTFDDVAVAAYTIGVSSRQYRFEPRTVEVSDTLTDINFVGLE